MGPHNTSLQQMNIQDMYVTNKMVRQLCLRDLHRLNVLFYGIVIFHTTIKL